MTMLAVRRFFHAFRRDRSLDQHNVMLIPFFDLIYAARIARHNIRVVAFKVLSVISYVADASYHDDLKHRVYVAFVFFLYKRFFGDGS